MALTPGTRLGREGGMGEGYRATDTAQGGGGVGSGDSHTMRDSK